MIRQPAGSSKAVANSLTLQQAAHRPSGEEGAGKRHRQRYENNHSARCRPAGRHPRRGRPFHRDAAGSDATVAAAGRVARIEKRFSHLKIVVAERVQDVDTEAADGSVAGRVRGVVAADRARRRHRCQSLRRSHGSQSQSDRSAASASTDVPGTAAGSERGIDWRSGSCCGRGLRAAGAVCAPSCAVPGYRGW